MLLLCACTQETNTTETTGRAVEELPDQESWSFKIKLSNDGIKSSEVSSGYMAHFISRRVYELSDTVIADFYDEFGNHTSRLTADSATINESEDIMVARNNVVVVSDSGITLYTDELFWDNKKEKIFTDKYFTFIDGMDTLYGYNFESDLTLKNYSMEQGSAVIYRKISKKK